MIYPQSNKVLYSLLRNFPLKGSVIPVYLFLFSNQQISLAEYPSTTKFSSACPLSQSNPQVEYLYDRYGAGIFEERDEYGHSAAHWMALNGHVAVARFMVEKRARIDLHSDNGQGPNSKESILA